MFRLSNRAKRTLKLTIFVLAFVLVMRQFAKGDEILPPTMVEELITLRDETKKWAITCPPGPFEGQITHTHGYCAQGDANFTAGISCLAAILAGDAETARTRCSDVALAQGPNGRWWRGPSLVEVPYPGTFSRDQARGTMAYLIAKGHVSQAITDNVEARQAARRWLTWIESQESNGRICTDDSRSCEITWGAQNMFFNTYHHIGVLPPWEHGPVTRRWYRSKWYHTGGLLAEIPPLYFEMKLRGKHYPVHLKAWTTVMYRALNVDFDKGITVRNRRTSKSLCLAARMIHRLQPDNVFYDFLRNGVRVSMVQKMLDRWPRVAPSVSGDWRDWSFQRNTEEKAWERADGHDFIAVANLIIARMNGRFPW